VQWLSFLTVFPLTFASSAFVPTDSMNKYLKLFAENQPITQVIEAVRALISAPAHWQPRLAGCSLVHRHPRGGHPAGGVAVPTQNQPIAHHHTIKQELTTDAQDPSRRFTAARTHHVYRGARQRHH
jgi:hypothetical protein